MKRPGALLVLLLAPAIAMEQGKVIEYNKDPVVDVPKGAAVGGAAGGLSGRTAGAMQDASDAGFVVRKCLSGRGWTVLDYDGQT